MERGATFGEVVKKSSMVLLFEILGTWFLVIFQRMLGSVMLVFAYWCLLALGEKISGSHYNPAVTAACMFRKNAGRFPRWLGIAYIIWQGIGGFFGALFAFMCTRSGGHLSILDGKHSFQAMVIETVGSFFFISIFLINTERNCGFFNEPGLRLLAIAASYVCVVTFSFELAGGSMNPVFGVCVNLTMLMDSGEGKALKWIWLYAIFPFAGAGLALLFHEFIFKKTQEGIEELDKSEQMERQDDTYIPPASTTSD
jgi:glycerol uptake facilitator-like aquaporin